MDTNSWISNISNKYKKKSNTRLVLDILEEALLNKDIKRGDALPSESALSSSLGVSKSSVREAVKMLEALGIVNVIQGKGSFICNNFEQANSNLLTFQLIIAERSPKELVEFGNFFEPMYMEIAMEKMNEEDHKKLQEYIIEFEKKYHAGCLTVEDDIWLHKFVLSKTDNSIIINMGGVLNRLIEKRIAQGIKLHPHLLLSDHKAICNALIKRDKVLLRKRVLASLRNWVGMNCDEPIL